MTGQGLKCVLIACCLALATAVAHGKEARVDLSRLNQPNNHPLQLKKAIKVANVIKKELDVLEKRATNGLSEKQARGLVIDMAMKINSKQRERLATGMKDFPRFARVSKITPDSASCSEECVKAWNDLASTYEHYFKCNPKCEQSLIVRKVMQSENVGTVCSPNLVC